MTLIRSLPLLIGVLCIVTGGVLFVTGGHTWPGYSFLCDSHILDGNWFVDDSTTTTIQI